MSERAIAHALIEGLCSWVPRTHFQGDGEYARYDGAFLEPLNKLASNAESSVGRSDSEEI